MKERPEHPAMLLLCSYEYQYVKTRHDDSSTAVPVVQHVSVRSGTGNGNDKRNDKRHKTTGYCCSNNAESREENQGRNDMPRRHDVLDMHCCCTAVVEQETKATSDELAR